MACGTVASAGQRDVAIQYTSSGRVAVDQGQYGLRRGRVIRQRDVARERMTLEVQSNDLIAQVQGA